MFEIQGIRDGVIVFASIQTRLLDITLEISRASFCIKNYRDSSLFVNVLNLIIRLAIQPPPSQVEKLSLNQMKNIYVPTLFGFLYPVEFV